MNELALFAGAGGGILGGHILGWRTICAVEWDAYAASILVARQNDGCLSPFPIWDDIRTFDGRPWRGRVDVVSGGFPCQDISAAGKGVGITGERSGMWKHMARIVGEVRPRFVFVENSPLLVGRGLAVVIADFAEMGYDATWGIVGAHHVAAPHKRDRIWIVAKLADPNSESCGAFGTSGMEGGATTEIDSASEQSSPLANPASGESRITTQRERREDSCGGSEKVCDVADAMHSRPQGSERSGGAGAEGQPAGHVVQCCCGSDVADTISQQREWCGTSGQEWGSEFTDGGGGDDISNAGSQRGQLPTERELTAIEQPWSDSEARSAGGIAGEWWATEPDVGRVAHGVAARVDRLRCIGNGQVPAVAALAWKILTKQ